jgi:hypothetical protein
MELSVAVTGMRGIVYIDPNATNPRSKEHTADYGLIEHARGGTHAFYARVEQEDGRRISKAVATEFMRGFKR